MLEEELDRGAAHTQRKKRKKALGENRYDTPTERVEREDAPLSNSFGGDGGDLVMNDALAGEGTADFLKQGRVLSPGSAGFECFSDLRDFGASFNGFSIT